MIATSEDHGKIVKHIVCGALFYLIFHNEDYVELFCLMGATKKADIYSWRAGDRFSIFSDGSTLFNCERVDK